MRLAFLLIVSPFALAVACGARTELRDLTSFEVGTSVEDDAEGESGSPDDAAIDTGPPLDVGAKADGDLGTDPVHCVGPPATVECRPGANCFMQDGKVVCGPPTGALNCGRVNCTGGCTCGGTTFGSWCDCH
jgi:hypothetical protein